MRSAEFMLGTALASWTKNGQAPRQLYLVPTKKKCNPTAAAAVVKGHGDAVVPHTLMTKPGQCLPFTTTILGGAGSASAAEPASLAERPEIATLASIPAVVLKTEKKIKKIFDEKAWN